MLRQLMQGTSWIALRAADGEAGAASENLGDPHGDEVLEYDPQTPLAEPEAAPSSEAPPVPETPPAPAPPVADPEPPKPKADWKDKEMARRARRIDEERTRAERAEAEAKRLTDLAESLARQGQSDSGDEHQPPPTPRQPPQDPERRYTQADIQAEARRIAAEDAFKRDFDSAYQGGTKQFGKAKMDEAIGRISELGGLDYDHLQMVLATDEPGKVLHDLGSRPEEFQRIMELPFNRRVAEFVKMGLKTEPKAPAASRAPEPVEPISGGGGAVDNRFNDSASDADWFAAEEKRALAHWKKRNSF